MKITKDDREWMKGNKGQLLDFLTRRMDDYKNQVIDETDPQKKEVLSMFVREMRLALRIVENVSTMKEKKKEDETTEEYTGV